MVNKWVIHTTTGEFKFGGFYEPTVPDAAHSIVIVPGEKMPDCKTQKWNGSAVVAKSQTEIEQAVSTEKDITAESLLDSGFADVILAVAEEMEAAFDALEAGTFSDRAWSGRVIDRFAQLRRSPRTRPNKNK